MENTRPAPAIEARELSRTFKGGIEAVGAVLIGLSLRAIEKYDR